MIEIFKDLEKYILEFTLLISAITALLGRLGFKTFKYKKQKKNGGTIYDKVSRLEINQKGMQVELRHIEKDIKEIKDDIRALRKQKTIH